MRKNTKIKRALWFPLSCGLLVIILFQFVFMIGHVPSTSMEPAIGNVSYIIGLRIYGELRRGDIVVFTKDGKNLVKRIAAVPGDIVCIDESTFDVTINGLEKGSVSMLTVPEGCFFLVGDNLEESVDSRFWADPFVPKEDILAKMFIR